MLSSEGTGHRVGSSSWNIYLPAEVGSDSCFPLVSAESGVTLSIDVLPDAEAVLISRDASLELSREQRQKIQAIIQNDQ